MFRRIPQPPINPALRDPERHDFWPGFVVTLVGLILAFFGARHLTAIETVDGPNAAETQLVKAFSVGGLQYPGDLAPPPPPAPTDDPAANAAALERWAKQNANALPPAWKVRVDTGAKGGCPT